MSGDTWMLAIWNLSLNGALAIAVIFGLRGLMLRFLPDVPRKYIVYLWAVPFFRLLFPLDLSRWLGRVSLIPWIGQPLSVVNGRTAANTAYPGLVLRLDSGISAADRLFNGAMEGTLPVPAAGASMDPFQLFQAVALWIWIAGLLLFLGWLLVSYLRLHRKIESAILRQDLTASAGVSVYESEAISTAFVIGWLRCRIYLPVGLSEIETECVMLHELSHIRRRDPMSKLVACLALAIHWFNPLVWLAYRYLVRDVEMACDERALLMKMRENAAELSELEEAEELKLRKQVATQYSGALLRLSMRDSGLLIPLAFGESGVKGRIRNALSVKQPRRAVCIVAILLCIVAAIVLISNPADAQEGSPTDDGSVATMKWSAEEKALADQLLQWRTKYVGDNSAVGNLLAALPSPEGLIYEELALETDQEPYRVMITYRLNAEGDTVDQGLLASNAWLLMSQVENLSEVEIRVLPENLALSHLVADVIYSRDMVEEVNRDALRGMAAMAKEAGVSGAEPTLWNLGGDEVSLLLLNRGLQLARDEEGGGNDGFSQLPNLLGPRAAAVLQVENYIEQMPYELTKELLAQKGFVVNIHGTFESGKDLWTEFLQGGGISFDEEGRYRVHPITAANPQERTLYLAQVTREGDWVLTGVIYHEGRYTVVDDVSRDQYKSSEVADYSIRSFDHLVYKQSQPNADGRIEYSFLLTDREPDSFTYEEYSGQSLGEEGGTATDPIIAWSLYSGVTSETISQP